MNTSPALTGSPSFPDAQAVTNADASWPANLHDLLRALSSPSAAGAASSPKGSSSSMAAWIQKRHFVEKLAGALHHHPSLACNLLLRLLRLASMVGAEQPVLAALEARAAAQLDQAALEELLIPAFRHTCGTLLDVGMALRLVRGFAALEDAARTGAANARVARLVDGYLAEAAVDANLSIGEFEALAAALPPHARASDDGLYRALDTFLKAHPSTTKQGRKALFRLIDTRKLSSEAALHATQNERLPVRAVIQVLFSEHLRPSRLHHDWSSGSFSGPHVEQSARCPSRREACGSSVQQQQELRKLREDVARLQVQCQWLQSQLDKAAAPASERRAKPGKTKKLGHSVWRALWGRGVEGGAARSEEEDEGVASAATTADGRRSRLGKSTPPAWRNSTS